MKHPTQHHLLSTLRHKMAVLILGVFISGLGTVQASNIQLDLSGGYNYDGFISTAEYLETLSYDPPADWGLSNRMVNHVFGQHRFSNWSSGNRIFGWQSQVGTGHTGLPDDGMISSGSWDFQLRTDLDASPPGGWDNPHYAIPTDPRGLLPTIENVIYVARPHTGTADPAGANYSFSLSAGEQQGYQSINFLMFGHAAANRLMRIYADYEDGQELLWTGNVPNPSQSLDPVTYLSHADLEVSFTTTQNWSNSGSPAYNNMGTNTANIFQFKDGLDLDVNRTLEGLTFHYVPQSWASADFVVLAASAVIPEPSSLVLMAIAGVGVLVCRCRRRFR